jgi:hypothetical protein
VGVEHQPHLYIAYRDRSILQSWRYNPACTPWCVTSISISIDDPHSQHTSAASHLNQRPVSHSKKLRPKCLICGKEYHAKKALNRHMNDRHSEEEEKCLLPGCPFKCFGRRKLVRHRVSPSPNPLSYSSPYRDLYSYSKLSIALALEPAPSSLPRTFLLTRKCGLLCDVVLLPSTRFTARRPSA